MSINYCTLTASTTDAFCGRSRTVVLARLKAAKYPPTVQGTNNQSFSHDLAKLRPDLVRQVFPDLEEHEQLNFEQPIITVSAELMGETGMMQLDREARVDFVMAMDFKIGPGLSSGPPVTVNITDLSI
jgi:hypothetical protein